MTDNGATRCDPVTAYAESGLGMRGETVRRVVLGSSAALCLAVGAMTAILTLVSGPLYGALGPRAFWFMAVLCAAALPIAFALRRI